MRIDKLQYKVLFTILLIILLGFNPDALKAMQDQDEVRYASKTISELQEMFYKADINEEISVDIDGETVGEALQIIARESGLKLTYRGDIIDDKKVTLQREVISVSEALAYVLEKTGLDYKFSQDGYLLINPMIERENIEVFQSTVQGRVTDAETGELLPGVSIGIEGTAQGTATDANGTYSIEVPEDAILVFSSIGYIQQRIEVDDRQEINVALISSVVELDEVVAIGYGVQRRSDITGSVVSVSPERLANASSLNIAQAIQGSISGVIMQTSNAAAKPSEAILVRGRNSIEADNSPLIIIDGIPGSIYDVHPNDVESIEVLKDASATAIYGSRASNGVILVSTKEGVGDVLQISYSGNFSFDNYANLPDMMDGEQFYNYKLERVPAELTPSEHQIYEDRSWTDWPRLIIQQGKTQQHQLSFSRAFDDSDYYLSLNYMDREGIRINDMYERAMIRFNMNIQLTDWLRFSTRSNLRYEDQSGASPGNIYAGDGSQSGAMNPLTHAYNEDGSIKIYPWPEDTYWGNALSNTLYDNTNRSYQPATNNAIEVDIPISGLSYRLNTGYRISLSDYSEYRGRNTKSGLENLGWATTNRTENEEIIIENILSYQMDFGSHNIFATGLYSYETNTFSSNAVTMSQFPNDIRTHFAADQAEAVNPSYNFNSSTLVSQMLRLNYGYDSRYLFTVTARRDGFSGFGADSKWGIFPSFAVAWNLHNEAFFPWSDQFSELKLRGSFGLNGNQAVGSYASMARLRPNNYVIGSSTRPGFYPAVLGQEDLGWEASKTFNVGIDFGILGGRFAGDVNFYHTETSDLLLSRTISPVHGISSIIENIGRTQNRGIELSILSRNISTGQFMWTTQGNTSWNQNKILSLYGFLDEQGVERDDVTNRWFIGQPIRVVYDYVYDGVWQLDEAEEAAEWGAEPGHARLKDLNGDGRLTAADDRQIIGQEDPKFTWGLTNTFRYRNFALSAFIYGIHGTHRYNPLLDEDEGGNNRRNVLNKNFWTPDNPTNDWWANDVNALFFAGVRATGPRGIENASFVRIKDITFSYDVPERLNARLGISALSLHFTVRNPFTFTQWTGTDPEIGHQRTTPMTMSYEGGLNLRF